MQSKILFQQMTADLINAGINYSRIAYRIRMSPSSIQKLMHHQDRIPRPKTLQSLSYYYKKIFSSPSLYGKKISDYYALHHEDILAMLKNTENILEKKETF